MVDETASENEVPENFFTQTFGHLIEQNLKHRATVDALFSDTVKKSPVHFEISIASRAVFGTGERAFSFNLYGRKLTFWNTDAGAYDRGFEPINYCIPFLVVVEESQVRGIFIDNTTFGTVDIGVTKHETLIFEFEDTHSAFGTHMVTEFIGTTIHDVLAQYTALTGRMLLPPLWALGHHQSRYSYMTQDEVIAIAKEFRARKIPCDAIYLDIDYMDNYKVFTWNKSTFPDFKGMVDQLHEMGIKLMVILDPGVKVEADYQGYESGKAQNAFLTYPDGSLVEGVVWPGLTHHPDFTNPMARAWWGEQLHELLSMGVDGIWNDMNEPLYFGQSETLSPPDYVVHANDGKGGNHGQLHNRYAIGMAQASLDALQTHRPNQRQLNITRAGGAGTQQYASSWTGDNKSTWDDLRLAIPMNLNLALSGQSFTGPDLGGFATDTEPELMARWYQACVLFPFYRNHSAIDTIRQEPWLFGQEIEDILRNTIELRYWLMPYLYTAFANCHYKGHPIMQPLFSAEPNNPHLRSIDDAYLIGQQILVAPILEKYALRRSVYLPKGSDWYLLDNNTKQSTRYEGGQLITVEAPLNTLPLFIKAGTVLPTWRTQRLDLPPNQIDLTIFAGNGTTYLYEDDGEGLDYQHGAYRWTTFVCTEVNNQVTVTRTVEGSYQRTVQYQVINPSDVQLIGF